MAFIDHVRYNMATTMHMLSIGFMKHEVNDINN